MKYQNDATLKGEFIRLILSQDIEDEELINILGQGDIELRFTLGN